MRNGRASVNCSDEADAEARTAMALALAPEKRQPRRRSEALTQDVVRQESFYATICRRGACQ
jgi:hypothetical protein